MAISLTQVDILTAFLHGIISFFSPCAIPLIPSFIALLISEKNIKSLWRILGFFIGLSATFSILGALSGSIGVLIDRLTMRYIAGSLILLMAILFLFQIQIFKVRSFNFYRFKSGGLFSGIIIGIGIGLVWIPCASPVLASILVIASTKGNVLKGLLMLFVYSLGISIPFLSIGGIVSRIFTRVSFKKPVFEKVLKYISAVLLFAIGILVFTGRLFG
ncbi:MAG TPA: cytochrome c biogenesis CcdA family protein [Pseudothermotoga sp.]|uniref:cytochrome c biogenesis CcdA family protein n=1 Tax=Thermotoga profunda TaxID=1508420 RepID=UPI0005976C50|nr:cytochrome c biogenesis CcdA family protein [Thermotoga profunda]